MSEWFWKKLSQLAGLAAIAGLFVLTVFQANIEIKDLDLWLHLGAGKFITQNVFVPNQDVFSCTIAGHPWLNHEWLFQILVYNIYSLFGFDGLIDLQVFIAVAIFASLLFLGYNKDQQLWQILVLLLTLLVFQTRFTNRPDLFSILFFVIYFAVLAVHFERATSVFLLVVLQMLWVNIHGFFIFGPLLVFIFLISEGVKRHVNLPFEWNSIGRVSDAEYKKFKAALPHIKS